MLATAHDTELDRGTTSVAPGTLRHCALTRELKPVSELIRFVVGPAGEVVPDLKRKLPGRGLWVSGTRSAVEDAVRHHVFARGFKRAVRVSTDLAAAIERLMERSALDVLAIAGKAGQVISGFAKVEAAIEQDDVKAVIHAADASGNGRRKLDAALRRKTGGISREIMIVDVFYGSQLDLALHCPNVVHAALLAGPAAESFFARVARLQNFRNSPANAPGDGARGHVTE
jgi:predicted RNA-binding protein YlxR (DUF448 family)